MAFRRSISQVETFLPLNSLKKNNPARALQVGCEDSRLLFCGSQGAREDGKKERRGFCVVLHVFEGRWGGGGGKIDLNLDLNDDSSQQNKTSQDPEPLLPPTLASDAAATWNGAVDATLGPAVRALAKRGL